VLYYYKQLNITNYEQVFQSFILTFILIISRNIKWCYEARNTM